MSYRLFAVTSPGLESFAASELHAMGISANPPVQYSSSGEPREESGGVEFEASLADLYKVNLNLRTANRILYRFAEFTAVSFPELRKKAARLPWETIMRPGQPVSLRVTCRKSKLYHSDGVAERVAGAIEDCLGKPSLISNNIEGSQELPQLIVVRFLHDTCSISIDTSGELLHRRGYRLETAKAPLRETLAAGMLYASGWDGKAPLIDPFCGSGTIAIEAALMARRIAPGKSRRFAFMNWPGYDEKKWKHQLSRAASLEVNPNVSITASDRDAGAIQIAEKNAERAGVRENINFIHQAISAISTPKPGGWVVTNPPYGVRLSPTKDLRDLYAQLGNVVRVKCPGWNVSVLCSSDALIGQTRFRVLDTSPMFNGGISVKLYKLQVADQ